MKLLHDEVSVLKKTNAIDNDKRYVYSTVDLLYMLCSMESPMYQLKGFPTCNFIYVTEYSFHIKAISTIVTNNT